MPNGPHRAGYAAEWMAKQRALGVCPQCGAAWDGPEHKCFRCRLKQSDYKRKRTAMRRTLVLATFVLAVLVGSEVIHAQSSKTYTLQFNHSGVNTDSYAVIVDGGTPVTLVAPTCSGSGATRLCTSTVTMSTGVSHAVTVSATGPFGTLVSDPFTAAPPDKPAGVLVK